MADAYVSVGEPHDGRPATLLMMVVNEGGQQHTEEISQVTARKLISELTAGLAHADRLARRALETQYAQRAAEEKAGG